MLQKFLIAILVRFAVLFLPILFWQLIGKYDLQISQTSVLWNRWDAPHFLYIAEFGYTNIGDPANFIVFPPLYPLIIKFVNLVVNDFVWSGILSSIVLFSIGATLFYKIVDRVWNKEVANKAFFLLLVFPTSYFFSAPYTESLFFLMAMTSIFFANKKQWFLAGLFGGLSFLTRHPGFLLLPTLLSFWYFSDKKIKNLLLLVTPFVACISMYLFINWRVFGDPLMFRYTLENHWQKEFAWPWRSVLSSWQAAFGKFDEYALQVGLWEAIPATAGIFLIPLTIKYIKKPYWIVWYVLTIIFITSTSFLLSTTRYLVSIPPLFVLLAIVSKKSNFLYYILIFLFTGLLTYFSMRFVSGQWAF